MLYIPSKRLTPQDERMLGYARIEAERGMAVEIGSTPAGIAVITEMLSRLDSGRYDISSIVPDLRGAYSMVRATSDDEKDQARAAYRSKRNGAEKGFRSATLSYLSALGTTDAPAWAAAGPLYADVGLLLRHLLAAIDSLAEMARSQRLAASVGRNIFSQPARESLKHHRAALTWRDKIDDVKARFVSGNVALVSHCVGRYFRASAIADKDDLGQEGLLGLLRAAEMWDPRRNIRFGTYATLWIKQYLRRYADMHLTGNISIPVFRSEELRKIGAAYWRMLTRDGHTTGPQLAADIGLSHERIMDTIGIFRLQGPSLSTPVMVDGEESFDLQSTLPASDNVEESFLRADAGNKAIRKFLGVLTPTEEMIIRCRYGLDNGSEETLAEIAVRVGRSRERIRQIEASALEKLRATKRKDIRRLTAEIR